MKSTTIASKEGFKGTVRELDILLFNKVKRYCIFNGLPNLQAYTRGDTEVSFLAFLLLTVIR